MKILSILIALMIGAILGMMLGIHLYKSNCEKISYSNYTTLLECRP